ncbi:acyl-CoA dehydrogenase family protein [Massilia cavernae]|uniref:Acyl-CoA dehydrogenase n=1 Tax=Massilia cavernae TaxID=2320864 RepID=A0A418Y6G4_9BURK|nr:acyl-CoA dehydrogenase family protein [Massilia cavernae]RJG23480.1 acyl-CoA dehydrogenase [Massilia cavernae]
MSKTLSLKAISTPQQSSAGLVDGVFTPEHQQFRETVRRFIAKEIDPYYLEWEKTPEGYPKELWKKGADAGFLGLCIPEQYGGPGGDLLYTVIMGEELGATVAGSSVGSLYSNDLLTAILLQFGTEEQKTQYFPDILNGDIGQALGLTEPDAGSDINAMRMRARKDGDDYLLSGQKVYISGGMSANLFYMVARTDDDVEAGRGRMTMFLVDLRDQAQAKGFERRRLNTLGEKAANVAELFLDNVRVPKSAILGQEGMGLKQNLGHVFSCDRTMIALRSLAATKCAFDLTVEFTKSRQVFGQRVFDFQNTQFKLAEMKANLVVGSAFRESLLRKLVANELDPLTASAAKLWLTENEYKTISDCLQLHGGYGYMTESPISRLFTWARLETIYAGTSEIQKATIAKFL